MDAWELEPRLLALERSFQEVQVDVGDLLARLGIDPPGVVKCNARIEALEKAVLEATGKAERI
jgi:hypothetical protein